MQIVIDIAEDMIKSLEQGNFGAKYNIYDLVGTLMNGTPLPDGAEILTKEAYSDLYSRAADVPDTNVGELISRQAAINALHFWFSDGFDEDRWWNSTHVLAAIEGLPPVQQEHKWETYFECPLSHGCPKIKCCTNEQAIEYASQIPNYCPLYEQPEKRTEECTETHACDYISRQAVLDIAKSSKSNWIDNSVLFKRVNELPSVEPERKSKPCDDAISRREAIKKFTYSYNGERIPDYDCDNFPTQIYIKTVKEILNGLPSVTPADKTESEDNR